MTSAARYVVARAWQAGFWTCLLGGLIALLMTLLLAVAIWDWEAMFCLLGLTSKSEVLKYLGIGVGGLVLILQAVIANRRANAMQQTAEAQVKANENTEHGLRQERLKNAIEHLGNVSESVRLGGAYELFHLAQDSSHRNPIRQTLLDILCGHIRWTTGEEPYQQKHPMKPSGEIQNLLTLLFMQDHDVFTGLGINLQESWLNGADLRGAGLRQADIRRARLNKANLNDADLRKAILAGAHLKEARLERTCLREADLFEVQMQGAGLSNAQLQGADMNTAALTYAFLFNSNLQGAFLSSTQMHGATLTSAKMQGAVLASTYLQASNLKQASLQGAGKHGLDPSIPFADRIRKGQEQREDLSEVVSGGLEQERVDQLVDKLLSPEKKHGLREALRPYIGEPSRRGLPPNHGAVLGYYGEDEAEEWIVEHETAMSATGRDSSLLPGPVTT